MLEKIALAKRLEEEEAKRRREAEEKKRIDMYIRFAELAQEKFGDEGYSYSEEEAGDELEDDEVDEGMLDEERYD